MIMNREDSFGFACSKNNSWNPYLEKEEEFKRINEKLEKKSSDLFERIENFSKSRRQRCAGATGYGKSQSLYGGGGGDSLPPSEDEHEAWSTRSGCDYYSPLHSDAEGDNGDGHFPRKLRTATSQKPANVRSSAGSRHAGRLQQATESVIQSLQAKLSNHEERMADIHLQYREKIQENTILESRARALEEERDKLFKTITSLQGTVEQHARNASTSKSNLNLKETTVGALKKEIEELKREQRIQSTNSQGFQARLHRVVEENERLKHQNKSLSQQLREVSGESRLKLDAQSQRIHELERQKAALNSNLSKQVQMVEKLKKRFGDRGRNGNNSQGPDLDEALSCFSS